MITLEKTKNDLFTIKYNKKYLHSKYDPIKESENFINRYIDIISENIVVVYGIGLGYHINQIIKINDKAQVYIFEGNEEIVQLCKQINPSLFENNNIKIFSIKHKQFYTCFSTVITKVNNIVIHKPSLNLIKDSNYKLYSIINNYILSRECVDESGLLKDNYIENLKTKYKNIKVLINKFNKSYKKFVITAAGPSLDNELKLLRENRDKFIIITVGSALNALMNNNIRPDIIVIIDGTEDVKKQFSGFENEEIPLCFLSTASRWAVDNYKGPKYMFFNSKDEAEIVIETGKTVAVAAISIALHCNAKEIVLLGQDLAFLNGKSHTNTFEKIYGYKDEPTINKYNQLVKGIDGVMLETTKGYIYFKEQIERLIYLNKHIKFVNCSKGAFIEGANHIEFKKYINV